MNRYPVWKYVLIVLVLLFGALYTIPNFFGESPAVQISSAKATIKLGPEAVALASQALEKAGVRADNVFYENLGNNGTVRVRFASTDLQFKAKSVLEQALNRDPLDPNYLVAFNLLPNTPIWLQSLHALPMYLGLDLRGGVHFLMQVDTKAVIAKRIQGVQTGVRALLVEKHIRFAGITRDGDAIDIRVRDQEIRDAVRAVLSAQMSDLTLVDAADAEGLKVRVTLSPVALKRTLEEAVQQNISTLSKRVNELGVAEPVIQQQGSDRIVVQLPGVQDVSRAKDIIGRTATLEVRMVDDSIRRGTEESSAIPLGSELFKVGKGAPVVMFKEPVITGDYISNAGASFDSNQQPSVSLDLNGDGGRKMREATRSKIGKLMAIVYSPWRRYVMNWGHVFK